MHIHKAENLAPAGRDIQHAYLKAHLLHPDIRSLSAPQIADLPAEKLMSVAHDYLFTGLAFLELRTDLARVQQASQQARDFLLLSESFWLIVTRDIQSYARSEAMFPAILQGMKQFPEEPSLGIMIKEFPEKTEIGGSMILLPQFVRAANTNPVESIGTLGRISSILSDLHSGEFRRGIDPIHPRAQAVETQLLREGLLQNPDLILSPRKRALLMESPL